MIETLLHLCGFCPDAYGHLDLMDLLAGGAFASWGAATCYLRAKLRRKRGKHGDA